jgi:cytoskeletal protein RodZ
MKNDLRLSAIREKRGISLEAISGATKISKRWLEAIERADYTKLPGGIYNTSYIRQYARAIQFDEAKLLAHYQSATAPQPAAAIKANSARQNALSALSAASIIGS